MHTHLALCLSRRDECLHVPLTALAAIIETTHHAHTNIPLLRDLAGTGRVRTPELARLASDLLTAGQAVLQHHPVERISMHSRPVTVLSSRYTSPHLATYLEFAYRLVLAAREYDRRIDVEQRILSANHPATGFERDLSHHLERRTYLPGETDIRMYQ